MRLTTWLATAGLIAAAPAAAQTPDTGSAVPPQVDSTRIDRPGVETGVIPPGPDTQTAAAGEIRNPETASVRFIDAQGNDIGTARVIQTSKGVLIEADIRGLPPGEHGFHFHQTGKCETPQRRISTDTW